MKLILIGDFIVVLLNKLQAILHTQLLIGKEHENNIAEVWCKVCQTWLFDRYDLLLNHLWFDFIADDW